MIGLLTIAGYGEPAKATTPVAVSRPVDGIPADFQNQLRQTGTYFEPNLGQTDSAVQFLSRGAALTTYFLANEVVFTSPGDPERTPVRMKLRGARASRFQGEDRLESVSAYFRGNDPSKWLGKVPNFGRIRARDVYPGVDLTYYDQSGRLEYDFIVRPGADPEQIEIAFDGVDELRVNESGDLVLKADGAQLLQPRPKVYQLRNGKQVPVEAGYRVVTRGGKRIVAFNVGQYEERAELVIDPVLLFSGYVSDGNVRDMVMGGGSIYTIGNITEGANPTVNPLVNGGGRKGASDIVITRAAYDVLSGQMRIVYRTFFGSSGEDLGFGIGYEGITGFSNGTTAVYICGQTFGTDLPVVNPISQGATYRGGGDAFIARLAFDPLTSFLGLSFSTYFGGADWDVATDIGVRSGDPGFFSITGATTGSSTNIPVINPFLGGNQVVGGRDAFVASFFYNPPLLRLDQSTVLGGDADDMGIAIQVLSGSYVLVAGTTQNPGAGKRPFPTVRPAQGGESYAGSAFDLDTFVCEVGPEPYPSCSIWGSASNDVVTGMVRTTGPSVTVTGVTERPDGRSPFPQKNSIVGTVSTFGTSEASFLFRFQGGIIAASRSIPFSTILAPGFHSTAIAGGPDTYYIAGYSTDTPGIMTNPLVPNGAFNQGSYDGVVYRVDVANDQPSITWSTMLGGDGAEFLSGIGVESNRVIVAGYGTLGDTKGLPLAGLVIPSTQFFTSAAIVPSYPIMAVIGEGADNNRNLTVIKRGGGGTVATNGDNTSGVIQCGATCTARVTGQVMLSATPSTGWTFGGWSGDCSGTGTCTVLATADRVVIATFYPSAAGARSGVIKRGRGNGTVSGPSTVCGPECLEAALAAGESGPFVATASPGSVFEGWSGGACSGTGACQLSASSGATAIATFGPSDSAGFDFVPLAPCRVVDTRLDAGALGKPAMRGQETRSFPFANSTCGIPTNASAYSLNFTVVPKGPLPYITAFPTGQSLPNVSTLNSLDGRIKANAAIVPAGTGGSVSVYAAAETELIVDINGYFVPAGSIASGLAFYPVTPCRIADTRLASGPFGGPALTGGATRTFEVPQSACGIPSTARAYSLNTTVVSSGPMPYLTAFPALQATPTVSTLNALNGGVVANAAIVPAGANGGVSFFAAANTDLVLDINGYFAPTGAAGALRFQPVAPCRITDTRAATTSELNLGALDGGLRTVPVRASNCALPDRAQAYALNATVVPATGLAYLTLWPFGPPSPPVVSTLNSLDGSINSNAAIVPAGIGGAVSAIAPGARTHLILDVSGYFAP